MIPKGFYSMESYRIGMAKGGFIQGRVGHGFLKDF